MTNGLKKIHFQKALELFLIEQLVSVNQIIKLYILKGETNVKENIGDCHLA